MGMQTKTIGRMPTNHGQYDPQLAYGKKFIVTLFDCGWESKHDNNTSAPATLNAQAGTITENTTDWKKKWGSYKQWLIDNGYQKMDASNVKDGNNTQHDINAAFADEIGSDSTPESIKGRVTTLEGAVGTGGSVDERIATEGAKHYLKSETYNKEEVNGMITTPDQGFVSVSATSETTAATDVLPATGEADTLYRVGNWDGTQYDATCYSEYAWNATLESYVKLSTKNVGIDDVPTAGSDKLVKSGGVYPFAHALGDMIVGKTLSDDIDLDISDKNNFSVLEIKNGHINTKNFNSEKQQLETSYFDYEISDENDNVVFRVLNGHIKTKNFNSEKVVQNPLFGEKIVWYGTSIPAAGYPEVCGSYLGATVYNEAVGSSACRMGYSTKVTPGGPLGDPYGITGMQWNVVGLSLSMKQEEKYDVFINWTTARRQANLIAQGYTQEEVANIQGWGELLTGDTKPADIMDSSCDVYRKLYYSCSYNTPTTPVEPAFGVIEGKVDKYLNQQDFPDLWVFDHGHNDAQNSELMKTIPTPDDDRTYFIGAVNYIIKHILSYNPRARFIFIGHYENDDAFGWHHSILCQAQQVLADYWNAPLYESWKMFGLSRNVVITTNAYWDVNGVWHESGFDGTNGYQGYHYEGVPENIRQENGVWVHDMSPLWIHMLDGLHPFQEEIKDFIGHSIAKYIESLVITY